MRWQDEAIVIGAKKFNEKDLIVNIFSRDNGLYSGVVRAGQSKTKLPIYQQGNIIAATWQARLDEQLGTIYAELENPISAKLIDNRKKLQSLISLVSLIKTALPERDPHMVLYDIVKIYLLDITQTDDWLNDYINFEIELLYECGFGLDLLKCAVTGKGDDLQYISPKTGRAVSAEAAVGYEDKLLKMPNGDDFFGWLKITEYFLEKSIYAPNNRKLPAERQRFVEVISRKS